MARLMGRLEKLFALAAVALLGVAGAAQPLPDFSGRWTAVPPEGGGGRGGPVAAAPFGSGWGTEFTLVQNETTLTVERAQFSQYDMQPPMRFTYALDGSENRITYNMGRGVHEILARASRQDSTLAITSTYRFSAPKDGRPAALDVKQVLSLDASGSLVVATTLNGLDGEPGSTSTTRYKKN